MDCRRENVEHCARVDHEDEQLDHSCRPEERRLGDMVSGYNLQQRRNRRLTLTISDASMGLAATSLSATKPQLIATPVVVHVSPRAFRSGLCSRHNSWRDAWSAIALVLMSATIPIGEAMVETKSDLSGLVGRHDVLVLATHLCESTGTLMDPLVAVDFLATRGGLEDSVGKDVVDMYLYEISMP